MERETPRYKELTAQIEAVLAEPLPPPAEKHLRREKLAELEYKRLGERDPGLDPARRLRLSREFAVRQCPQNVFSYPMHLRETVMNPIPNYLELYALRVTHVNMRREIDALSATPGNQELCREKRQELFQLEFNRLREMAFSDEPDEPLIQRAKHLAGI